MLTGDRFPCLTKPSRHDIGLGTLGLPAIPSPVNGHPAMPGRLLDMPIGRLIHSPDSGVLGDVGCKAMKLREKTKCLHLDPLARPVMPRPRCSAGLFDGHLAGPSQTRFSDLVLQGARGA